jgi:hypothetical protein
MLKDVISAYFRHQHPPGRDLVERGDYRLVYGNSRTRVEPTMWTYTVNTGLTVEMSMVLRRRNGNGTTCPRCNEEYHGEVQSGWVDWKVLRTFVPSHCLWCPQLEHFLFCTVPIGRRSDGNDGGRS